MTQKPTPEPCMECGRMLRSKKSIDLMRGPSCQKKYLKRKLEEKQLSGGGAGRPGQLQARPAEVYLVSDLNLIKKITQLPRVLCETIEVQVFTDLITYRWTSEKERHTASDMAQDAERYIRIKSILRETPEGVKRVAAQGEMELAV